jgi:lipoprotein-anchoring transpeptidase ErfK/SrfK
MTKRCAFWLVCSTILMSPQITLADDAYGGGFLQFLLGGGDLQPRPAAVQTVAAPAQALTQAPDTTAAIQATATATQTQPSSDSALAQPIAPQPSINPIYQRQEVDYDGPAKPGTIVIDTPNRFLFLIEKHSKALRYGIGVGRPGFEWAGIKVISRKAEWPDWNPPPDMLKRRPDLPTHMAGGPENPLGARALYLGASFYRIHGTNQPETIGTNVSSGCIRMMNDDVIDLYNRVKVGTKVIVM